MFTKWRNGKCIMQMICYVINTITNFSNCDLHASEFYPTAFLNQFLLHSISIGNSMVSSVISEIHERVSFSKTYKIAICAILKNS